MLLKVFLLFIVFLVVSAPLFLSERLKVKPEDVTRWTPPAYERWKGPKTDERINRMFAECIAFLLWNMLLRPRNAKKCRI